MNANILTKAASSAATLGLAVLLANPSALAGQRGYQRFDGANTSALVPTASSPDLDNTSFTIEFWVSGRFTTSPRTVVASDRTDPFVDGLKITTLTGGRHPGVSFGWAGTELFAEAPNDFGIWVHWACVYDAADSERRLYRNGELMAQGTAPPFADSGMFRIGGSGAGLQPLDGNLDELRVWRRALDGVEIRERLDTELDVPSLAGQGLIAYYPMGANVDLGVGTPGANDIEDHSGNGAHADCSTDDEAAPWKAERDVASITPGFTTTVTTNDFRGEGSIYEAWQTGFQPAAAGGDTVQRIDLTGVSGTIAFDSRLILAGSTIIEGPGADVLTLDGSGYDGRAFVVVSGATVVLRGVTLSNFESLGGDATPDSGGGGDCGYGGGIVVQGGSRLHCENVVFVDNRAIGGDGAVALPGGSGGAARQYNVNRPPEDGQTVGPGGTGGRRGVPTNRNGGAGGKGRDNGGWDPALGGGGEGLFGFAGGNGGYPGGGGGGGEGANSSSSSVRAGNGGRGGDGGAGGHGGFGAGGGAGGSAGGGGGGGDRINNATPGDGGSGGDGGALGLGGFGAGDGGVGPFGAPGARGEFDSGFGGWGGGVARLPNGFDPSNSSFWRPLGGGGGGAGLGGAIFVHTRAALSLKDVQFNRNHAQGGRRGIAHRESRSDQRATDARGIGSAIFLMPIAKIVGTPGASYSGNTSTGPDGTTPDQWTNPVYGIGEDVYVDIRGGSAGGMTRPLYYYAAAAEGNDPAVAAFRYKWSIWSRNATSGGAPEHDYLLRSGSGAADPDAEGLYTQADRSAVATAHAAAEALFLADPTDVQARELLFDICYDAAAVLGFLAEFALNRAERDARNVDPVLQSSLDEHIEAYAGPGGVLDMYRDALACFDGVIVDPQQYSAFAEVQPGRHFSPLQYIDDSDPVASPPPLRDVPGSTRSFDGYRDLALLYDLLGAHGEAGLRLVELYLAREAEGDREQGRVTAAALQRFLFTQGELLSTLLPQAPPEALSVAVDRWGAAVDSLADIQTRLASEVNALGFSDDFLLLVGGGAVTDSFAYLYERLDTEILGKVGLPGTARWELDEAIGNFDSYQASRTEFADRREDLLSAINSRLEKIGSLDDPAASPGELDEQVLRIENARTEIELNRTEVSNLHEEIRIAVETNDAVKAANLTIADIKVNYIDRQRALDRDIAQLEAAQATADRAVGFLDVTTYPELFVKGANMAFQGWADQQKIKIGDSKAELAGAEVLEIADAENVIRDAELDGFIKTRLLDLKRLALESLVATNVLTQEFNRMAALVAEKERLERERSGLDASLAGRYYADPVHGLRVEDSLGRADISFRRARLWTFIVMRAFEYKWNQPFSENPDVPTPTVNGDGVWDKDDLFASRNARDLRDLADAIRDSDAEFEITFGSGLNPSRNTVFSVRDDFFGYGGAADIPSFRDRLAELSEDDPNSADGDILIPFHTVRTPRNDSFFRGASYGEDPFGGYILDNEGVALNKVVWVKIVVIGDFDGEFNPFFQQNRLANSVITYGGTTYVRNINVGTLQDPDDPGAPVRPDRIFGEMTAYETRNYDLTGATFPPPASSDVLRDTGVEALVYDTSLSTNPGLFEDDAFVNRKFAERSVAATDWSINLEVGDADFPIEKIDDILLIIQHQNYDRTAP